MGNEHRKGIIFLKSSPNAVILFLEQAIEAIVAAQRTSWFLFVLPTIQVAVKSSKRTQAASSVKQKAE